MGRGWWYKPCEKRLPLKCHSFRERSNFPRIWFRDLRFRTWGLEINHLNAHNFMWQGCFFLSLLSRNFDDRLSSNFHRFVILCICWDTQTVKASLWQLSIVSTAFRQNWRTSQKPGDQLKIKPTVSTTPVPKPPFCSPLASSECFLPFSFYFFHLNASFKCVASFCLLFGYFL